MHFTILIHSHTIWGGGGGGLVSGSGRKTEQQQQYKAAVQAKYYSFIALLLALPQLLPLHFFLTVTVYHTGTVRTVTVKQLTAQTSLCLCRLILPRRVTILLFVVVLLLHRSWPCSFRITSSFTSSRRRRRACLLVLVFWIIHVGEDLGQFSRDHARAPFLRQRSPYCRRGSTVRIAVLRGTTGRVRLKLLASAREEHIGRLAVPRVCLHLGPPFVQLDVQVDDCLLAPQQVARVPVELHDFQ